MARASTTLGQIWSQIEVYDVLRDRFDDRYVLRHNEHFLIDTKDPAWAHYQLFKRLCCRMAWRERSPCCCAHAVFGTGLNPFTTAFSPPPSFAIACDRALRCFTGWLGVSK